MIGLYSVVRLGLSIAFSFQIIGNGDREILETEPSDYHQSHRIDFFMYASFLHIKHIFIHRGIWICFVCRNPRAFSRSQRLREKQGK